mgnify:FL=1
MEPNELIRVIASILFIALKKTVEMKMERAMRSGRITHSNRIRILCFQANKLTEYNATHH